MTSQELNDRVQGMMERFFAANGDGTVRALAFDIARLLEQDADCMARNGYAWEAEQQAVEAYQWRLRGGAPRNDADAAALRKRVDSLRSVATAAVR